MSYSERSRPKSAHELLAAHSDVAVRRDRLGVVTITDRQSLKLRAGHFALDMIPGVNDEDEPTLTLYGDMRFKSEANRTRLRIPFRDALQPVRVLQQGRTEAVRLAGLAYKGACMIDDYLALPPDEQWEMVVVEGGPDCFYDELRSMADTRQVYENFALSLVEQQIALDGFALARGIFLGQGWAQTGLLAD